MSISSLSLSISSLYLPSPSLPLNFFSSFIPLFPSPFIVYPQLQTSVLGKSPSLSFLKLLLIFDLVEWID